MMKPDLRLHGFHLVALALPKAKLVSFLGRQIVIRPSCRLVLCTRMQFGKTGLHIHDLARGRVQLNKEWLVCGDLGRGLNHKAKRPPATTDT